MLAEILEPIMGTGLIPADLETWKPRRRAIVPAFHRAYLEAMVAMFGACTQETVRKLERAADRPQASIPRVSARLEAQVQWTSYGQYQCIRICYHQSVRPAVVSTDASRLPCFVHQFMIWLSPFRIFKLRTSPLQGEAVDMEEEFLNLGLDIIGLGVFNYKFGSITTESPVIKASLLSTYLTLSTPLAMS